MKICVCGGGNLGHVAGAFMALQPDVEVAMLTRSPEKWHEDIALVMPDGGELVAHLSLVTADVRAAVSGADYVVLCLPGFALAGEMRLLAPFLESGTVVGAVVSSTGFFFTAEDNLPAGTVLFGLQRVPFISRTIVYGSRAHLMGTKPRLEACVSGNGGSTVAAALQERVRRDVERMFGTRVFLLDSIYEASLSNSNPLLHPARLYSLWRDWDGVRTYDRNPLFYEEWTDEASELLVSMDKELFALLDRLPMRRGSIVPILEYYESADAVALTRKLRSIRAFRGIASPMRHVPDGYIPDVQSRYFTEDFSYGLAIIRRLAKEHGVDTPAIDRICDWGFSMLDRVWCGGGEV